MKRPGVTVKNLKIIQLMKEMDYDPIKELILMVKRNELEIPQQITVHKELAQYCAPKLKSVEISASDDGTPTSIKIVKYSETNQDTPLGEMVN